MSEPRRRIAVTLDRKLIEKLDEMAKAQQRSRSNMVEWLIRQAYPSYVINREEEA